MKIDKNNTVLKQKNLLLLLLLTLIGAFLHFYNLNWGAPFYFHPDERNIASSVSQLNFPIHMNPNFFAYGSLPIYAIYFTGIAINFFIHTLSPKPYPLNPTFAQAIIISRFYSALFATLLIPILFSLARCLNSSTFLGGGAKGNLQGWTAALLATFSVGFIQFAHFGTFEMWLTFCTVLLFWLCLSALHSHTKKIALLLGITSGVLISTKISHLVLLPLPVAILLLKMPKGTHWKDIFHQQFKNIRNFSIFIISACLVYIVTNPFVFLDYPSFTGSMKYESSVALGTEPVFYTGEFFSKAPLIFQFLHSYPFLLNPLLPVLFLPAFFFILYMAIKTKNAKYLLLITFFLILFFSQALLFAKWTRYMVPTLPFIYLIVSLAISYSLSWKALTRMRRLYFFLPLFVLPIIFSLSYFITAFVEQDTRLQAKQFASRTIPADSQILSEVYDLGITPFNDNFHNISLFNFYDLDNNSPDANNQTLQFQLQQSDYLILPSQRIIKTRLLNKKKFPNGYQFYKQLTTGSLGFKKIYETPCDIFCQITYLGSPIYSFEETANVFDRPMVFIFQKIL